MAKGWTTKGIDEAPTLIDLDPSDVRKVTGKARRPHAMRKKRKAVWVYLSERERDIVTEAAIEKGESLSEFIRNAVKKAAKC